VVEIPAPRDLTRLSRFVSEKQGGRYAQIDADSDIVLKPFDLRNLRKLQSIRNGDRMMAMAPDELCRLITVMIASSRCAKGGIQRSNNTTSNASEVFPDSIVVEYHCPSPADQENAG
jgi:hypothetical protein